MTGGEGGGGVVPFRESSHVVFKLVPLKRKMDLSHAQKTKFSYLLKFRFSRIFSTINPSFLYGRPPGDVPLNLWCHLIKCIYVIYVNYGIIL